MNINWLGIFLFLTLLCCFIIFCSGTELNTDPVYPINQLNGNESVNPMEINQDTGVISWDTEEDDAGIYMVEITASDGNSSDSETVRILVHQGNPLISKLKWFHSCWLTDKAYFDYNEDGTVNLIDYAEMMKD